MLSKQASLLERWYSSASNSFYFFLKAKDAFSVCFGKSICLMLLAVQARCANTAVSQVSKALQTEVGNLLKITISGSAKIYNLTNK